MSTQKNFAIHLDYNDDYKEISLSETLNNLINVYIICKYSFVNQNVDIEKLVRNNDINIPNDNIRLNFSVDEIMSFKKKKIDFYIVDEDRLNSIFTMRGINISKETNITLGDIRGNKFLCFDYFRYISFSIKSNTNSNINIKQTFPNQLNDWKNLEKNNHINTFDEISQDNININKTYQPKNNFFNNGNITNNEDKTKIITILILLFGNEKGINNFYSQGFFDFKECYLVNKTWIDKFKEIYHYNKMYDILSKKGINSFTDSVNNLQYLESLDEIKSFSNHININNSFLIQMNLSPVTKYIAEDNNYYPAPINFSIIHKSILNLLKNFSSIDIQDQYEINFGKSSLCIRAKNDLNKIYIYELNNNSFYLLGIIDLFADAWKSIYDRHLSKKHLRQFFTEKNIDLNVTNRKQNYLSSGSKLLGYIYIISQKNNNNNMIEPNVKISNNIKSNLITEINENNIDINKITNKNADINSLYINLMNSFNSLQDSNCDLPNYKAIQDYLELKIINNLHIFIIENSKFVYFLNNKNALQNNINYSSFLSESDIISCDTLSESTKYSFINEDILKYFNIQNTEHLPKFYLFINKKIIYIFYPKQNCLLKVVNYNNNNSFNIKFLTQHTPVPPPIPPIQGQHALGLENIGATCYMNATLQCLGHVKLLKNYLLDDNRYNQDIISRSAPLTKSFADVVRKLWSQTYENYFAPREFKDLISQMNPLFQGIQANDSKDLILFIFENIHRELNNPGQNPDHINLNNIPNTLYQFRQKYYSENYSIISKIFYYEQSSIMECMSCHYKTFNFNIMNMIIFPLEKVRLYMINIKPRGFDNVSIYDCFEQSEQQEMLEGANQIYCNNCRLTSNASSCNKLYTCPEVLTIILNRGKGLEFKVEFKFTMDLNIDKYVIDQSYGSKYDLIGVLTHFGPSGMAGHFVAYCKSPIDNQWYFYNDATVTACGKNVENDMQKNGIPYILFYQRKICKTLYFNVGDKEGYFDYTDENELLSDIYNKIRQKYDWVPEGASIKLYKNNQLLYLDLYKSIKDNNICDKDKIWIISD